jgi:hypothetical protein
MGNPLLVEALGAILRHFLSAGAVWFVAHGIWKSSEAENYVSGLALFLLAVGWSIWQKYGMRSKLVVALSTASAMTEQEAATASRSPVAPSVMTPKDQVPK